MTQREILVTHALPYANGPLHIGHLLGYIQSDIWVRARRMAGDTVHFVAADDVHGTPIMLAAEKAGMAPEEFIQGVQVSHERDFADFGVAHDYYYTTHSEENRELAELVYKRLRDDAKPSHIATKSVRQFYDPVKQMFLPDRYVKGTCPNCGTPDQYGDNCENCGATYAPTDLINPHSVVSGATPELRDSEHYFFKVGDFAELLRDWLAGKLTDGKAVHSSVAAKLNEWLDAEGGVRDWDISRDAPYFGFPIPDAPGKFFYVWLDAPIGYLASFKKYCASAAGAKNGLNAASFDHFMQEGQTAATNLPASTVTEMHHFIGKDIVNFHGLFWPAMLKGAKLRIPNALHVNGYLTVNGEKMSKSRGTFVMARTYLDAGLNPDYLRYYFATMLTAAPVDVDLDLKAFEERVNSHLVGKWVNLASRCARLLETNFDSKLGSAFWNPRAASYEPSQVEQKAIATLGWVSGKLTESVAFYRAGDFARAANGIVHAADVANEYVTSAAPWSLIKDTAQKQYVHIVLTAALNMFRAIACALKPIVPFVVRRVETFFRLPTEAYPTGEFSSFKQIDAHLADHEVAKFEPLMTRVDSKYVEAMVEASKDSLADKALSPASSPRGRGLGEGALSASAPGKSAPSPQPSPPSDKAAQGRGSASSTAAPGSAQPSALSLAFISIDDFAKLDLRIGKVLTCGFVDGSDKLLRFELDAGELGKRQIFSGIRAAYGEPEKLIGRNVVFIANLAPRKMRFGVSEGMILSAGNGGDDLRLLDVDAGALPGATVK